MWSIITAVLKNFVIFTRKTSVLESVLRPANVLKIGSNCERLLLRTFKLGYFLSNLKTPKMCQKLLFDFQKAKKVK